MTNPLSRIAIPLAALALFAAPAKPEDYALANVRIAHSDGSVVEVGLILIANGKIAYVGEPRMYIQTYITIDCKGQTAYPGFIDAYSNDGLDLPDIPDNAEARDAGNGPLPSFWHANRKGVYSDLDISEYISAEDLEAPNLYAQGVTASHSASGRGAFGGRTAVVNLTELEDGSIVATRVFQEMSFRGGRGGGYPGSTMARIALIRQILFDAEYYIANPPDNGEDADPVLEAAGDAAIGLTHTLFTANSEREIQRAFNLADEFGLKLTINGGLEAWKHADALKERGVAVILDAEIGREPRREANSNPLRALNDPPLAVLEARYQEWVEESKFAVKLQAAGVKFAFSGDDLLDSVREHIKLGLPKAAALRALTIDAAEILGVSDKLGSLTAGKIANIVLMDGDFADDETKVKTVFIAGKKIDIPTEED